MRIELEVKTSNSRTNKIFSIRKNKYLEKKEPGPLKCISNVWYFVCVFLKFTFHCTFADIGKSLQPNNKELIGTMYYYCDLPHSNHSCENLPLLRQICGKQLPYTWSIEFCDLIVTAPESKSELENWSISNGTSRLSLVVVMDTTSRPPRLNCNDVLWHVKYTY